VRLADIQPVKLPTLTVSVTEGPTVAFVGTITVQKPQAELGRFLGDVHAAVVSSRSNQLTVDVTRLTFINSSAVSVFIEWVRRIQAAPPEEAYKLCFLTNPKVTWHHTTFSTLRLIAPSHIEYKMVDAT
jgi:hypothetical protein